MRVVSYPGSSVWDFVRPRSSSQPAAASLPDALGGLITQSVVGIIERAERSSTGASVLIPVAQLGFVFTAVLGRVLFSEPLSWRKRCGLVIAAAAMATLAFA